MFRLIDLLFDLTDLLIQKTWAGSLWIGRQEENLGPFRRLGIRSHWSLPGSTPWKEEGTATAPGGGVRELP